MKSENKLYFKIYSRIDFSYLKQTSPSVDQDSVCLTFIFKPQTRTAFLYFRKTGPVSLQQ